MMFARQQPGSDDDAPGGGLNHPHAPGRSGGRSDGSARFAVGSGGGGGSLNRLNLLLSSPSWRADGWADRLPTLLEPMGVSAVRAGCAREAERVIRQVPVHIAVVDLSVPLDAGTGPVTEEGGTRILEMLARLEAPPPTVVIQTPRTARDSQRSMSAALRCGAFAVVDHSAANLELLLGVMQRCLSKFYQNQWPSGPRGAGPSAFC